ncbi:hypothetical protein BDY24DRAFT_385819 [Mrakia frigida]|uniref:uncharacterized protein n=1 Tax=Mrakia frigida TaxID=29902 RepID=UPI003FCBFE59
MRLVHALAAALLLVPEAEGWQWTAARERDPDGVGDFTSSTTRADPSKPDHLLAFDNPSSSSFDSLSLSPQERQALFSSLHLLPSSSSSSSTSEPDCFRSVASKLRARCTPSSNSNEQDSFLVGESQRIDAAILLTLCDLTSARTTPPSECSSYLSRSTSKGSWWDAELVKSGGSARNEETRRLERQGCVESLSRSPQFWSSYSGYVREATQLCFALQRSNEIDRAQKIYVNATLEKIALLQHLKKNEEQLSDRLEL